jgi:hypothetical protein
MTSSILLRVAAVLAVVQGLAHGSIILFGGANRSADESGVIAVMKSHLFGAGAGRSYWDYYIGYALFAALTCILEGVLFWAVSGTGRQMRPVALVFLAGNLGYAALVGRYFPLRLPIVFDLAIAVCLGLAVLWG